RYLLVNPAASRFVGKAAGEVLGRDDTAVFDPESARRVMERDRRVMAAGVTETAEEELTAAGVTRVYQATKGPYRDGRGNVVGLIGISRDVTHLRRTEQALRREREFVRLVLDTDPNLIFVKDTAGRFVLANKALADLYGTTPEALVGRRPGDELPAPAE